MTDEILAWVAIGLAAAGLVLLPVAAMTWPRGQRRRCPGPRARALARLSPRCWLVRGRCWYDLRGQPLDSSGAVRCPECGCRTRAAALLADGRRLRVEVFCALTILPAGVMVAIPSVQSGAWARVLPTPALVTAEWSRADLRSNVIRGEVQRRVRLGEVQGWSASLLVEALGEDLLDDEVRWNADRAELLLRELWPTSRPVLERALRSGDVQARILAAHVLRAKSPEPSDDLLWACVEDLRDDADEVNRYLSLHNASAASTYLVGSGARAEPHLARALRSDDRQQRLLAAAVAGHVGLSGLIDEAAPILIEHLRDNSISGDAKVAAPALYRFGPDVIPFLEEHTESDDPQLRACALAIIERLQHPDRPLSQLEHPMPRITELTHDPLRDARVRLDGGELSWPDP